MGVDGPNVNDVRAGVANVGVQGGRGEQWGWPGEFLRLEFCKQFHFIAICNQFCDESRACPGALVQEEQQGQAGDCHF